MTLEIGFLFVVLAAMVYLFLTERIPIDLTAFVGLVVLVFTGYVDATEAFEGFASSAVITMMAIFIISASLLNTGIADSVGGRIHRWVGGREVPLVVTVMLVAGVLSAFMNNIAATAVLMPAVASLGRRAGLPPSRLFMPLAFGAILGGTTTLVGTPPNILAGAMLRERGLESFELFDFAPIGAALLVVGTLYMVVVGRRLLPATAGAPDQRGPDLAQLYHLEEDLVSLRIPPGSRLDGATLAALRIGSTLGARVVAILRGNERVFAPGGDSRLQADDELLLLGSVEELHKLLQVRGAAVAEPVEDDLGRPTGGATVLRAMLHARSSFLGQTLRDLAFRERFGLVVVHVERDGSTIREGLAKLPLRAGDVVLGLGADPAVAELEAEAELEILGPGTSALQELANQSLFLLELPTDSPLVGTSIGVSRMGELMGLVIAGILRGEEAILAPPPEETLQAGDRLLVSGERSRVTGLLALGDVRLEDGVSLSALESDDVAIVEASVAPRSSISGRSLRDLDFRDRFGLQVLAVWREGKPLHHGLAELSLRVGDALLLHGRREEIARFARDPDFVVLTEIVDKPRLTAKAPFALGGLLLMIALVVTGYQPIQVAAFAGATMVVLLGALSMEEAYRAIEWRAIFLVAAVLPVGVAMEKSGAAQLLANLVIDVAGPLGPYAVLASLVALSSLLSQGLDGAPAVVLLTPVVLQSAEGLAVSPYPLMMGVGLAASAAFMTPFSHKANLLVMGLGGYRSADYLRVGTPLTVVLLALIIVMVPMLFPF